jgi:hypothetical protein
MTIAQHIKKRFTPAILAVLLNYGLWRVGVFLDRFPGDVDVFGAHLCRATYALGVPLILLAILYAVIRRYILPKHEWDFCGPVLAALAIVLMWLESEMSVKI